MARYIVDTNVVLRFLLADDEKQSPIARSYFIDEKNHLVRTYANRYIVGWVSDSVTHRFVTKAGLKPQPTVKTA